MHYLQQLRYLCAQLHLSSSALLGRYSFVLLSSLHISLHITPQFSSHSFLQRPTLLNVCPSTGRRRRCGSRSCKLRCVQDQQQHGRIRELACRTTCGTHSAPRPRAQISGCRARSQYGGAICNKMGSLTILTCSFEDNHAGEGWAIWTQDDITVINSTFIAGGSHTVTDEADIIHAGGVSIDYGYCTAGSTPGPAGVNVPVARAADGFTGCPFLCVSLLKTRIAPSRFDSTQLYMCALGSR